MTDSMPESWLDDVREQAADRLSRIARMQEELSSLSAEGQAADGRVRVRVNAAGRPIALTLTPGATSMPAADLATAILGAVDAAAEQAGARLAAVVGSLVPSAELDAMLTGRPTAADRAAVRDELDALRGPS